MLPSIEETPPKYKRNAAMEVTMMGGSAGQRTKRYGEQAGGPLGT